MIPSNPSKILPELRQQLTRDHIPTLFRAENKMYEDVRILMRHLDNIHNRASFVCDGILLANPKGQPI
jgi:hypothetical protein